MPVIPGSGSRVPASPASLVVTDGKEAQHQALLALVGRGSAD